MDGPDVPAFERMGVRVPWQRVPASVRAALENDLGSRVIAAADMKGGYSPAAAARLTLADGRRLFVKAVGAEINGDTPDIVRREAAILGQLPSSLPVPRLEWFHDDGAWVALGMTSIAGHLPASPWRPDELAAVMRALDAMTVAATPSPLHDPTVLVRYGSQFDGWRRLAADASQHTLDAWTARNLDELAAREPLWESAAAGDSLLHCDVRADNILIDDALTVHLVDWPSACRGQSWIDVVFFAASVYLDGGPEPETLLTMHAGARSADPDAITAVVNALAGYFTYRADLPAPQGLPTVRAFQAAQGVVTRAWLAQRTGLR